MSNVGQIYSIAHRWFEMTREDKLTAGLPTDMKGLCQFLGVGYTKIRDIKMAYRKAKFNKTLNTVSPDIKLEPDDDFDPTSWLKGNKRERFEATLRGAKAGNAQAMKLLHQLAEEYVEKQEVTHKIDGGDIARAILRARREREEDSGVDTVSGEFSILPKKLRLSAGQSKRKNRKVGKLEPST